MEQAIHDPFAEVERLWYAAEYTCCLGLLSTLSPCVRTALWSAKCYQRLYRYDDVLRVLAPANRMQADAETRYRLATLAALAHAARGDEASSLACLRGLHTRSAQLAPSAMLAEAESDRAFCARVRGDLIEAEAILASVDAGGDANVEGAIALNRSFVRAGRGRLAEQASLISQALLAIEKTNVKDVGLMARMTFALAAQARDLYLPDALPLLDRMLDSIPWTGDIQLERFQTLRGSGWAHALQGNYITAIRRLGAARDIAPSHHLEILSRFDGAWIAKIAGEHCSSQAQALDAFDRASQLDWTTKSGEECAALLIGAEILSYIDHSAAAVLLARYDAAYEKVAAAWAYRRDPRSRALKAVAEAAVAQATNDANRVRQSAKAAFDIYDGLGIAWRAARCALQLYRAGAGDEWLAIAKDRVADYKRSFVAEDVARYEGQRTAAGTDDLTARQREIFSLLRRGLGIDEVAKSLSCSPNTIRVHIGAIYRKLGVTSRVELLTKTG